MRTARSIEARTATASNGAPSEKRDALPELQAGGPSSVPQAPLDAEVRGEASLGVGRQERLEDAREDLGLLDRLLLARLRRRDGIREADDEPPAGRDFLLDGLL